MFLDVFIMDRLAFVLIDENLEVAHMVELRVDQRLFAREGAIVGCFEKADDGIVFPNAHIAHGDLDPAFPFAVDEHTST